MDHWRCSSRNSKVEQIWTYHPNVGSGLQLCIDPIATKVRVHLQTCRLGKVNVGLQAHRCHNVISFHLQGKALVNQWLMSCSVYTEFPPNAITHQAAVLQFDFQFVIFKTHRLHKSLWDNFYTLWIKQKNKETQVISTRNDQQKAIKTWRNNRPFLTFSVVQLLRYSGRTFPMLPFSGNIWITSSPESAAEVNKEREGQTYVHFSIRSS